MTRVEWLGLGMPSYVCLVLFPLPPPLLLLLHVMHMYPASSNMQDWAAVELTAGN